VQETTCGVGVYAADAGLWLGGFLRVDDSACIAPCEALCSEEEERGK
jgi:hypothetical protein